MLDQEYVLEDVVARSLNVASGEKTITTVIFETPMTPSVASMLDSWPLLYTGDNLPRQGYTKLRLDVRAVKNIRLRSGQEWDAAPFEANPMSLSAFEAKRTKSGLMLCFKARFDSYAIAVFDFVNEASDDPFTLRVGPAAPAPAVSEDSAVAPAPEPAPADLEAAAGLVDEAHEPKVPTDEEIKDFFNPPPPPSAEPDPPEAA